MPWEEVGKAGEVTVAKEKSAVNCSLDTRPRVGTRKPRILLWIDLPHDLIPFTSIPGVRFR